MCSMYWNLTATFTCPICGHVNTDTNLQTHWMGEVGSCSDYYVLGEKVAELAGVADTTFQTTDEDHLGGDCEECGQWFDFGMNVKDESVIEVWPFHYTTGDWRHPIHHTVPR